MVINRKVINATENFGEVEQIDSSDNGMFRFRNKLYTYNRTKIG